MKMFKKVCSKLKTIIAGFVVGIANGLLGGGGGMLAVPALEKYCGLENKKAHATSLAVILPMCVASSIVYIIYSNPLNLNLAYIVAGSVVGGVIGSLFLKKFTNATIRLTFFVIIFVAALRILVK